ncbi:MAG TPA: FHA domain-containing protein [Thermodesulfobacteriota bacterium]|nr:FHA domain-containing protein [Thermodesulfobacteriota bacterium]
MGLPAISITLNAKEVDRKVLDQEIIAIGRDMDNDIVINNLAVSRCHAILTVLDDKIIVKDMASSNGTFINGKKIEEGVLNAGDLMLIGKHILRLEIDEEPQAVQPEENKEAEEGTVIFDSDTRDKFLEKMQTEKAASDPRLVVNGEEEIKIKGDFFAIGKRYDADINISGLFINEHHAIIQKQKEGTYKIINMGSFLKPTKVNDSVIKEKILQKGDVIQIGNYRIVFSM